MHNELWRFQDYDLFCVATIRQLGERIGWAYHLRVTNFSLNGVYCCLRDDILDDARADSNNEVVARSW